MASLLKRILGSKHSKLYTDTKNQLRNLERELKGLGSKHLSQGEILRFRGRYHRIVEKIKRKNFSPNEYTKLKTKLSTFETEFKNIGFMEPPAQPNRNNPTTNEGEYHVSTYGKWGPPGISETATQKYSVEEPEEPKLGTNQKSVPVQAYVENETKKRNQWAQRDEFPATHKTYQSESKTSRQQYNSEKIERRENEDKSQFKHISDSSSMSRERSSWENSHQNERRTMHPKVPQEPNLKPTGSGTPWNTTRTYNDPERRRPEKSWDDSYEQKTRSFQRPDPPGTGTSVFGRPERENTQETFNNCHASSKYGTNSGYDWRLASDQNQERIPRNIHQSMAEAKETYAGTSSERSHWTDEFQAQPSRKPAETMFDTNIQTNSRTNTSIDTSYNFDNRRQQQTDITEPDYKMLDDVLEQLVNPDASSSDQIRTNPENQKPEIPIKLEVERPNFNDTIGGAGDCRSYQDDFDTLVDEQGKYSTSANHHQKESARENTKRLSAPKDDENAQGDAFNSSSYSFSSPQVHKPPISCDRRRSERVRQKQTDLDQQDMRSSSGYRVRVISQEVPCPPERYQPGYVDRKTRSRFSEDRTRNIEVAKEAVEGPSLQILDVHKYFRDDFDINSVDLLTDHMAKIDILEKTARQYEEKVLQFSEEKYSLEYFVLDEKLMRLIEKLDKIKCQDEQDTTNKKVQVIEYIKGLHSALDERAKDE